MSSFYRDTGLPVNQVLAAPVSHNPIPTPVVTPISYASTVGIPLGSNVTESLAIAASHVNNAYASAVGQSSVYSNNITNVYNNTSADLTNQFNQARSDIITTVNNSNDRLVQSFNNALSHISDVTNAAHNSQIDRVAQLVTDVSNNVNHMATEFSNQARIDLSPIERSVANITASVHDSIDAVQRSTENIVQGIYNSQARIVTDQINASNQHTREISETITNAAHDVVSGITKEFRDNGFPGIPTLNDLEGFVKFIIDSITKEIAKDWSQVGQNFFKWFNDRVDYAKSESIKSTDGALDIFKELANDKYKTLGDFVEAITKRGTPIQLIQAVVGLMVVLGGAQKISEIVAGPYFQKLAQLGLKEVEPSIPTVPDLIKFVHYKIDNEADFKAKVAKLGFNQYDAASLLTVGATRLSAYEYLRNTFIFNKNVDEMKLQLSSLGIREDDINVMMENYLGGIPPVQDLIRFMVRDTFSPIAETFGQFEEFPEKIMDYWAAQPLDNIWARHYWAAHWELPSIQQVFEMFHRRKEGSNNSVVDRDQLVAFLKAKDIMPYWRDKLLEISYTPVTRVDIRRLFNMGLWSERQVFNAYKDIGYNDTNAEALTKFTIHSNDESDITTHKAIRKLQEDLVDKAYSREVINEQEAIERLVAIGVNRDESNIRVSSWKFDRDTQHLYSRKQADRDNIVNTLKKDYEERTITRSYILATLEAIGYSATDAEELIKYSDIRANLTLKNKMVDNIRALYVKHRLEVQEAVQRLTAIGSTQQEIEYLLRDFDVEREKKDKQLTVPQVLKAYSSKVMTEGDFYSYMHGLGYDDKEIYWLQASTTGVDTSVQ